MNVPLCFWLPDDMSKRKCVLDASDRWRKADRVSLSGMVANYALIERAIILALDTDGA